MRGREVDRGRVRGEVLSLHILCLLSVCERERAVYRGLVGCPVSVDPFLVHPTAH